tara:strand:- start:672306 stop:672761 length:456 start_codon:yes stop_codon:yes gene_type:complete
MKIKSTILLLFFISSLYAQEYSGKGVDINIILKNVSGFSKAYMDGNFDALTNFYSSDAKIFPDETDIISGHAAIKKRWTLPKGVKILSHKIYPKEINVINVNAYDYGYYAVTSSDENGNVSSSRGKYVIVWKKVKDDWKIYLDIWNTVGNN